jgi:hypothetical protein
MRALVIALVVNMFGCGDPGPRENSVTVDELCDATNGVYTRWRIADTACFGAITANTLFTDAYFEHQCRVYVEALLATGDVDLAAPSVISEARAQLDSITCNPDLYKDWLRGTEAINRVLVGRKGFGTGCSTEAECAPGNYCKRSDVSPSCGVCEPRRADGGGCNRNNECTSGLCYAAFCRTPKDVAAGGSCGLDEDCATGLFCRKIVDNTCVSPADSIGQSCAFAQYDCPMYSASCVNYKCALNAKQGESCARDGDNSAPRCSWLQGYGCGGISRLCEPLPLVGPGQACGEDTASCVGAYQCLFPELRCGDLVSEGAPCTADNQCGRYGFCRSGTCSFSEFDPTCP